MKRNKHHKVKKEMPESSASHSREQEDHDLAYYIHDRVELMHQVFSVLKYKDIKAMAPASVRNISIDDLQELCTEELLGISSKRLCAILDGAEPPSDTESSSQSPTEQLETISLDSISSDEAILSQDDRVKKKKHKHRRHDSKSKSRHKKSKDDDNEDAEKSKASRAGLTVLELLELQARARAIRAQLQQEQAKPAVETSAVGSSQSKSSEDEVEIKEEPAEVVEISSDEEKPKIEHLQTSNHIKSPNSQSKTVTKKVNDLIITVPQHKTQKIKLNRTKTITKTTEPSKQTATENIEKVPERKETKEKKERSKETSKNKDGNKKEKSKKKKKKRPSNGSDNDEITLQLSDTEKMDLLEDLDRKSYDNFSSETSTDSETDADVSKKVTNKTTDKEHKRDKRLSRDSRNSREKRKSNEDANKNETSDPDISVNIVNTDDDGNKFEDIEESVAVKETELGENENLDNTKDVTDSLSLTKSNLVNQNATQIDSEIVEENITNSSDANIVEDTKVDEGTVIEEPKEGNENASNNQENIDKPAKDKEKKQLSEGELSDRESSEVEVLDLKPEVVCISDEEEKKSKKKKKKKEKKSKKEKKNKKKDFRESSDQNFHKITDASSKTNVNSSSETEVNIIDKEIVESSEKDANDTKDEGDEQSNTIEIDLTTDQSQDSKVFDVNDPDRDTIQNTDQKEAHPDPDAEDESPNDIVEISDEVYELSDDSSNEDETETRNVLSKEPTTSEIEALSAKIDEIERVEVITEDEIREYESKRAEEIEDMAKSWKDRYLESNKVKKVLNTSNILNALRKKNKQLKKSLEESKLNISAVATSPVREEVKELEVQEGSIEQYNTLEGSTKYVDPVKEVPINDRLKNDAKQLLKMYKKLLKYNDMTRQRDPSKKKKKKRKTKKDKEVISVENKLSE